METVYFFILVPMTYIAWFTLIIGLLIKGLMIWRRPAGPTRPPIFPQRRPFWLWALMDTFFMPVVLRCSPGLWMFLFTFHAALVLLFLGHLELIADLKLLQVYPHEIFLGGGLIGLILVVASLFFLSRRFFSPAKDVSRPEDYFLLILIFLTVIFGSQMDWARRLYGYRDLGVADYREYIQSLLLFKPEIRGVASSGHSFMLVAHVFFANLLVAVLPFSKLVHFIFAIPLNKLRRG